MIKKSISVIIILSSLFLLGCNELPSNYGTVVIDNRTLQEFIVIFDDMDQGKLIPGGVDRVMSIKGRQRDYQLRWITGYGVNIIYIPITFDLDKVYVIGDGYENFSLEFVRR